ncbi:MAG: UDP-N-acetylmuramoyl-L-alanine--D-glutamate ligase [Gemmatimonadota bacterium]
MQRTELTGRRILLLGLGVENQAVGRFLRGCGIPFGAADAAPEGRLEGLRREWADGVDSWVLGPGYLDGLDGWEVIFRTPGVHPRHPALERARRAGALVTSQTRLFLERCPATVVGITGTKGKGTTARLLEGMLQGGAWRRVWVAGNIGTPPISFADEVTAADIVVLELSSFQLQDLDRSPPIAVLLSVTRDHLDYHGSVAEYAEAKGALCRHQDESGIAVVDGECPAAVRLGARSRGRQRPFGLAGTGGPGVHLRAGRLRWCPEEGGEVDLFGPEDVPAPGRHNLANAAAAAGAALSAGVAPAAVAAGLRLFRPLPHRLERIAEIDGVTYYDDSLATNPDAALAALRAFDGPVILIAGGSPKGADFRDLAAAAATRSVRAVILLGQEGARLDAALAAQPGFAGEVVRDCGSMVAAVAAARVRARAGDVVLLSPACASFGMFRNYAERGDAFQRAVRAAPAS